MDRWHDAVAVDIDQLTDRHDLVAAFFQVIEDHGQSRHGGTPVAAAVVEKNNIPRGALVFDSLKQLLGRWLLPITGIDVFQYRHVAEGLRHADRLQVADIGRVGVRVERWAKQGGGAADEGFDEPLGGVQLELHEGFREFAQVGVGEGVVADFVALVGDALEEVGIKFGIFAKHEKDGLHAAFLENIEDGGRPIRIRAIVEGNAHAVRLVTSHAKKGRVRRELDIAAGNPPFGILGKGAPPGEGGGVQVHDFSFADRSHRVAAQNLGIQRCGGVFFAGGDDLPNAGILEAEPVEGDAAEFGAADGVPLIGESGGIREPDLVRLAGEVVGKIGVEGWPGATDFVAAGISRAADCIREGNFLSLDLALGAVVAVNSDPDNPLRGARGLRNHIQPTLEPIERNDGAGGVGRSRFLVKNHDEAVHMRGEIFEIPLGKCAVGHDAQPSL